MTARVLGAGLAGLLAIALAACGSSSGDGTGGTAQAGRSDATTSGQPVMPDLVGTDVDAAQEKLIAVNPIFDLRITYERTAAKPDGTVLEQSLPPGTPLPAGERYKVKLVVASRTTQTVDTSDLCRLGNTKEPPEIDCDPATGKFVLAGRVCHDHGATGTLGHLECAKSRLCHDLRWTEKGPGSPPAYPCGAYKSDHPIVIAPGAECDPGQPLPYPYVCRKAR